MPKAIFSVEFIPNQGTRYQHSSRQILGPYSTETKAKHVRDQIIKHMRYDHDTSKVVIVEDRLDQPDEYIIDDQRLKVDPNDATG